MPPAQRPRPHRRFAAVALAALVACGGGKDPAGPAPVGTLEFLVTGLPGGTASRIAVTGPDGVVRQVTGSGVLTGLPAGTYLTSSRYVIAQNQTWTPQVPADTVALAAGDTVQVVVAYTGGALPSVNYGIAGYQLIQSVQRTDNSVPMVALRAALIRVFATASAANTSRPTVRLRLFQGGVQVDSFDVQAQATAVPPSVDTAALGSSWNVLIPAGRMIAGLAFSAELDPEDAIPETDKSDNRFPASGVTAVAVQSARQLDLRLVPVLQSANGLVGAVNDLNKGSYFDLTTRMLPLGATSVDVRAPFTTSAPVLQANDGNGGWSQILSEMNSLRISEGNGRHYVGVVPVTYGGGIAGLGYVGVAASVAWDKLPSAPEVIAHELGHNFGRNHAPCGNPSGVDAQFPYANAAIGVWGVDLGLMQLRSPATYKDLMSYCNPDWISDYTYVGILAWRGPGPSVAATRAVAGPGLLVWGRVVQGNVILEPAFEVHAPPALPQRAGAHRIEGFDAQGTRLFGISFEGDLVPDLPGGEERHFAFVVPLSRQEISRLASLRLMGQGLTARRMASAALTPGPGFPPSVLARASGGETAVSWDPAYPLAVIRDGATGEILGFGRGGAGTVAAGGRAIRVDLSNGVTSVAGTVAP